MINFYVDTESIGYFSPTVLIQYARDDSPVHIHNLWKEPVGKSLDLIEEICENNIIGFNLAHDWFHLSRTYNVLQMLPQNKPPAILDYHDVEDEPEAHDRFCLKPHGALDLMLYGRTHEFQATMGQKTIRIRRVPRALAKILVQELETQVEIPKLYFAKRDGKQHWKIKELHMNTAKEITPEDYKSLHDGKDDIMIDPNFVNIELAFHPSTGLKPIMHYLLGKEVDTIDEMLGVKRPTEYSWYPSSGEWLDVAADHIFAWTEDKRRLQYAEDDVHYLRDLVKYFANNNRLTQEEFLNKHMGEYNSTLACMVGALHWKGFAIDINQINEQLVEQYNIVIKCEKEVMFNSPKKVISYLHEVCNPIEKELITNTEKATLLSTIEEGSEELSRRAKLVMTGRQAKMELKMLERLKKAKRLYVTFKVTGTKSNRMSGGSMEEE